MKLEEGQIAQATGCVDLVSECTLVQCNTVSYTILCAVWYSIL